jgi:hypothetical protein
MNKLTITPLGLNALRLHPHFLSALYLLFQALIPIAFAFELLTSWHSYFNNLPQLKRYVNQLYIPWLQ